MNKLNFKGWELAKGGHQEGLFSYAINDEGFALDFNGIKFADFHFINLSENVIPDSFYTVNYELKSEKAKTFVVFGWYDAEGKILIKGYAENGERIVAPENANTLEIAVNTYSREKGRVEIKNLSVEYVGKYEAKPVVMAAVAVEYDHPAIPDVTLRRTLETIDRLCAEHKTDIIVLTETFYDRASFIPFEECSYPEDCEIIDKIKAKAKQYGTYICFSFHEIEDEVYYNTAFLIDRNGKTIGKYRKTHLTMNGYEGGMAPGDEIVTFDTELGRIGIAICWDLFFPGFALEMFKRDVDIVCHPTAGANMRRFFQRAIDCGAYLIASTPQFETTSVLSPDGDILALAEENEGYAVATVDMNRPEYKYWQSYPSYTEAKNVYRKEARWDLYQ